MKKIFVLFAAIFCFMIFNVALATGEDSKLNIGSNSNLDSETNSVSSGEVKAEIYLRPEDAHPNGVNIEIGTASFWLEVGAKVSGDSGATVSYQWYESTDGTMENIKAIEGETKPIFIPEQKIGTTFYCVGVITTVDGKSKVEYTKLLEATFTPKMIDKIWLVGVKEPASGEKIENTANQYTDYDLNSYYGYEINSVSWSPEDTLFKAGQEYRVDIEIEYWDNVTFTSKLDVKVNNKDATIERFADGSGAIISCTFDKLEENKSGELIENIETGENENSNSGEELNNENVTPQNDEEIELSTLILVGLFITLTIFSLMIIIKRK